jgi:hypothetical protein
MELNLVKVTDLKTNKSSYYAVNDKHYDAMLAGGGSNLDLEYSWDWLGDVIITEEILNEEGLFYKDEL